MPKSPKKNVESDLGAIAPDLDSRENIERFVDLFYKQVLKDAMLAPLFLDVAKIDLKVHLPHIKAYWCKLLLGERGYDRHTMNIHRRLHAKRALESENFERWLSLFVTTVDENFLGVGADKAKRIARSIARNMQSGLNSAPVKAEPEIKFSV